MLYSYAFMVSGLFVPVIAALYTKKPNSVAAIFSMIFGGSTTIILTTIDLKLPLNLDANIFGIAVSALTYFFIAFFLKIKNERANRLTTSFT